jgi:hypothetical protein
MKGRTCLHAERTRSLAAIRLLSVQHMVAGVVIPAGLRCAHPATWRSKLLKVAATIVPSTRRILLQLAAQWPFREEYHAVGRRALLMPSGP